MITGIGGGAREVTLVVAGVAEIQPESRRLTTQFSGLRRRVKARPNGSAATGGTVTVALGCVSRVTS